MTLPGRDYTSSPKFRLGYQGQEYESKVGMYGFSLRLYDQRLGRWFSTDPYGQHWSPYLAMSNNPVSFVDPDGGEDDWWDRTKVTYYVDGFQVEEWEFKSYLSNPGHYTTINYSGHFSPGFNASGIELTYNQFRKSWGYWQEPTPYQIEVELERRMGEDKGVGRTSEAIAAVKWKAVDVDFPATPGVTLYKPLQKNKATVGPTRPPTGSSAFWNWIEKVGLPGFPGAYNVANDIYIYTQAVSPFKPNFVTNLNGVGTVERGTSQFSDAALGGFATVVPVPAAAGMKATNEVVEAAPKYLYHYTTKAAAKNIAKVGLKTEYSTDGFIYLTNKSNLSPLQAQIELGLRADRTLPNSLLQVDISGIKPSIIRRVQGNLTGMGPGGGTEFLFNLNISANRIKIIK